VLFESFFIVRYDEVMNSDQLPLKFRIKGWYILLKGKIRGKSNDEIIDEQVAQYKQHAHGDRIFNAKLDEKIEKMKRGGE